MFIKVMVEGGWPCKWEALQLGKGITFNGIERDVRWSGSVRGMS